LQRLQALPAQIDADASDGDNGGDTPFSRQLLLDIQDRLTQGQGCRKKRLLSFSVESRRQPQQMGRQALQLLEERSHVTGPARNVKTGRILQRPHIGKGVGEGAGAAEPLGQRKGLKGVSLHGQGLDIAVE
jgi:hypothetical protein